MEKRGAVLLEVAQRRLFVDPHQAAVADDVTGENRGKSAFGPFAGHRSSAVASSYSISLLHNREG